MLNIALMTKDEEIAYLRAENAELRQKVTSLEEKVRYLLELLTKQSVQKDSHNSHNSPSQDKKKPKRNTSLRPKTSRSSGGQSGHPGKTLEMTDTPDQIQDLRSDFCSVCGEDVSQENHHLISKRQEIVLPPIQPVYIEYRQWGIVCNCGHHQKASFPENIKAPIQFGADIIALVSYLNVFQYIPYKRLKLLMKDIFNLNMSEGSVQNLLNKAAKKSYPIYQSILHYITIGTYVGSDETGANVNGKKWWIWVWQNLQNTFLKASQSRGFDTIEATFPEGLPDACIGSDRWAAQLKINSNTKQLCFPHLLRDLNFLIETEKDNFASHFKDLLKQVLKLRSKAVEQGVPFSKDSFETYKLNHRLNRLLARVIDKESSGQTFTFQKSMIKHRNHLFTCLYNLEVPPDNNASERAIRNVKVKQKISGQFKSGQDTFCILRSVIDTLIKRNREVLPFLKNIMSI